MKTALRGLVPALMMLLVGCASSKPAQQQATALPECPGPAWTCFASGPCPFAEYKDCLCAVGQADGIGSEALAKQAAMTRARREMAAVIESQVDGFTRATQDSMSKAGQGEDSIQKVQDLAQNVVQRTLNGVAVPKTWRNPQSGAAYAIAVLDAPSFTKALKGLKDAKGLSDAVKMDIDRRADDVVNQWQSELARKGGALPPGKTPAAQQ